MTEKTVSNRFSRGFLGNQKNTLCFVGYCDPETPGGRLRESQPGDKITLAADEDPLVRRCAMETFDFSGHAPREHLLDYVRQIKPDKCMLVHGDDGACQWFASQIAASLPGTETIIPKPGTKYNL